MEPTSFRAYEASLEVPRVAEVPDLSHEDVAAISEAVFMPHNPQPADVLFLFGTVQADWDGLVQDIRAGNYGKIILAGKIGPSYFEDGEPIAAYMEGELCKRGVPSRLLQLQPESDNTLEDVQFSLPLLGSPNSITYAAKAHHSGRCQRTLRRFFPEVTLCAHTVDAWYGDVIVRRADWQLNPVASGRVYGEYQRILKYSAKGDIALEP